MPVDKRKALQNALTFTQQGKWDKAIAEYQGILKADPRDLTVCNNLGDLYARAGRTAEAIEQYSKLGELYRADGLSVKAIAVYKKIAKLDLSYTGAYQACADLYWEQGLVGEAKIQMATVVDHYTKADDTAKLIEAYRRLTQFEPTNISVLSKLGDLLLTQGLTEAAATEYEKAAKAAQSAGQADEGRRLLAKARELVPEAAVMPGPEAPAEAGQPVFTLDVPEAAASGEPENSQAWRRMGEVLASQGKPIEAAAAFSAALKYPLLPAEEADILRELASAQEAGDQTEAVVATYRRLLDLEPENLEMRARLEGLAGAPSAKTGVGAELGFPPAAPLDTPSFSFAGLEELGLSLSEPEPPLSLDVPAEVPAAPAPVPISPADWLSAPEPTTVSPPLGWAPPVSPAAPSAAELPSSAADASGGEAMDERVIELLAEAEVYQKYGLEEKARARFLEALEIAPDNMAAHRGLCALYEQQHLVADACDEVLAIARLLRAAGQIGEAMKQAREGLGLNPDHAGLRDFLGESSETAADAIERVLDAPLPIPDIEDFAPAVPEPETPVLVLERADTYDGEIAEDLSEAEFYLSQGMLKEASAVHRRMHARNPDHPSVAGLGERIQRVTQGPAAAPAAPEPQAHAPISYDVPTQSIVGAPLEQFRFKEDEPPSDIAPSAVEGLTQGFQVVEVNESSGDGATHYDLGVAYKEMELYDEAIQEFQLSEADPGRALASAEMLAACHLAKGRPDAAVQALLKGLETAADGPDAARVRFALGGAYEALGQPEQALAEYIRLESDGATIPGLPQRLAALRARGVTGPAPAVPVPEARRPPEVPAAAPVSAPEPVAPAAPAPPTADATRARRKKISYI